MPRHYPRKPAPKSHHRPPKVTHHARMRPEAEPVLKGVFAKIGRPIEGPFTPDPFQLQALEAIERTDCLVMAPTGSGKTWIAEQAIQSVFSRGGRCWYASPLKALTNAKWVEFGNRFSPHNVGILTGDTKENAEAPIIVGTTEILRNQLYDAMHRGEDLPVDLVILDEAHFLGDRDRGVVWEEVMIYLPVRINLLLLSATIGNGEEIARWLSTLREKACIVVREEKRPVPLYPLFLHPSGKIIPYLEQKKIHGRLREYIDGRASGGDRRGRPTQFGEIIRVLEQFNLLPAIFFLKSRSECDGALKVCQTGSPRMEDDRFYYNLQESLDRFPFLQNHRQLPYLRTSRVAAHHGGQLPAWKFLVETMMKKGFLDAIFATSTVAAGVNFPARTIVLCNSDQFNGREFNPLSGTEFHQMTGRAGRRGIDRIGFMLVVPTRFMDLFHVRKLLFKEPEDITSQIRNDFSMVLNILLSHKPDEVRGIFERSLAMHQYQAQERRSGGAEGRGDLWRDFLRHLQFLKQEGFVDEEGKLTETGLWASRLRLDQPLLIAECLRQQAFPRGNPQLLAAMVAPFVYDGDQDIKMPEKRRISRQLLSSVDRVTATLKRLTGRMKADGFPVNRLYLWTSLVIYEWARGSDWDSLIRQFDIAEGDMASLIMRTADNLRQISALRETHPEMAELAQRAREAILREPVVFEFE